MAILSGMDGNEKKEEFLNNLDLNDIGDYKEIASFAVQVITANEFLVRQNLFSSQIKGRAFLENCIKALSEEYHHNKEGYFSSLEHIDMNDLGSKEANNPYLYVLRHFLPNFIEYNDTPDSIYKVYNDKFYDKSSCVPDWKSMKAIMFDLVQYSADLIQINPVFAQYIYNAREDWSISNKLSIIEALYNSQIVNDNIRLQYLVPHGDVATHVLEDSKINISEKYMFLEHNAQGAKKALVIYGYDHNGAFAGNELVLKLFNNGYDVLVVDARTKTIALSDIKSSILDADFKDLDEVYVEMHGGDPMVISDTLLVMNNKDDYFSGTYNYVTASDLFQLIADLIESKPIKAIVASCNSQLLTHKIANILPEDSEILTLSENQHVMGKHYNIIGYTQLYDVFNKFIGEDNLGLSVSKIHYYLGDYDSSITYQNNELPSSTYGKIGECNFRASVNVNKEDIAELQSKNNMSDVVLEISEYLSVDDNQEKVSRDVEDFFDKMLSSDNQYPLFEYRENNDPNFHKYLGISEAMYDIYGQCGNGDIKDSSFVPNEDYWLLENVAYLGFNYHPLITNTVVTGIGKVINYLNNYSSSEEF